ncbi:MAG: hypothetical protein WEB06_21090 [Actinomycetota bacterium]
MSIRSIVERSRAWGRDQAASLTHGQRWTSALALGLAGVMLVAGMPSNVRVIAAPPTKDVYVAPPLVPVVAPPVVPVAPPLAYDPPVVKREPSPEPPPEPEFTPPPPTLHSCATDEGNLVIFDGPDLPVPVFATMVEQFTAIQAQYEEMTGQPLGVDLASVAATIGQCTDALPNVPALVTISVLLNQVYDALEAAGVPPIDLPNPPVVSLPDVPAPLRPVLAAMSPVFLPVCTGIPFFGVGVGVGGALALAPIADGLLPFPMSEVMPYLWPVRALCSLLIAYAPEAEAVPATGKPTAR